MKLSMSTSSSKSTVKMFLIQILSALLRLANWKLGFTKIKRIETLEPGPQYYRIGSHCDTLQIFAGRQICLLEGAGSGVYFASRAGFGIRNLQNQTSRSFGSSPARRITMSAVRR